MSTVDESHSMSIEPSSVPNSNPGGRSGKKREKRVAKKPDFKVFVSANRLSPLRDNWMKIFSPLVEQLKLQVRMNERTKTVELCKSEFMDDPSYLQKGVDFVKAFVLGFDVEDALALLRLDDLYIDSFEIKDVKTLNGDHLSRAIGRLAGKDGKTKYAIENASRTRIVLADSHIHILGTFQNIRVAKDALVSLIRGSPPGKVYSTLRSRSNSLKQFI